MNSNSSNRDCTGGKFVGFSCRIALTLLVTSLVLICEFNPDPFVIHLSTSPSWAKPSGLKVHGSPLDESVIFYQYTDKDGVINYVDSYEKIPRRYRQKTIVRSDMPVTRQTTRVAIVDKQIHVPVSLTNGGKTAQAVMLFDTGASITSITEEFAARLNIDLKSTRPDTIRLADGSIINIRITTIDSVSVGNRVKSPLEIGILPHFGDREVHDGFLGIDFLSEFKYQIDYQNNLIYWQ